MTSHDNMQVAQDLDVPGVDSAIDLREPPEKATKLHGHWPRMDQYFGITAKGSTVGTELLAGVSTYLALSYIFVVNPSILASAGIDRSVSLFATLTISAIATLVMGLWARLPFVLSTGLEMNGYIAFFAIGTLGFTWQEGLGMVFWSGVLMLVVTLTGLREKIIDCIPDSLKLGLSFAVGMFLVLIAGSISGILVYDELTISSVGSLTSPNAILLYLSLAVLVVMLRLRVPGAIMLSIVGTSVLYQVFSTQEWFGFTDVPFDGPTFSRAMFDGVFAMDLGVIASGSALSIILVLFILDFYGSIAKFIGLTASTSVMEDGTLPRRTEALLVDGGATAAGSALGTTSVTTFVESAVGIGMGARTGLMAVSASACMFATFLAFPLIQYVPVAATAGALVYVGLKLCPSLDQIKAMPTAQKVAVASMPVVTAATFALDKAMLAGFGIVVAVDLVQTKKANPFLVASTLLLAVSIGIQELR